MRKLLAAAIILVCCANLFFWLVHERRTTQPVRPHVVSESHFSPLPPAEPSAPERREVVPSFVPVPIFRTAPENSVYGDVLSHSQSAPFGDSGGRATNSHETAHGIHSYLRNKYSRDLGKRVNGFYCLEGRGVILEEPDMRKRDINDFVPQNLRSYRYDLYLEGQQAWDDTPLYIYDEWVAYVLGGKTNVEDVQTGRYKGGWTDGVSGCLGFSIYAVATCMAIQEKDPDYWANNKQFRDFTIWMLRESYKTYMIGHEMEQFKWDKQDMLLNELLVSSSAEPMRNFMREHLQGVWLDTDVKALRAIHYGPHQRIPYDPKCECQKVK